MSNSNLLKIVKRLKMENNIYLGAHIVVLSFLYYKQYREWEKDDK